MYGKDSFALLLDEGGDYEEHEDVIIAFPWATEKGEVNVQSEVNLLASRSVYVEAICYTTGYDSRWPLECSSPTHGMLNWFHAACHL